MGKKIVLVIALLLACCFSWGQRIPSSLENPVNENLARRYRMAYACEKGSRIGAYASLGVTAAGTGLMLYTLYGLQTPDPDDFETENSCAGGDAMVLVFEYLLTLEGACGMMICSSVDLLFRYRLKEIRAHNDFLQRPGMTEEMWEYELARNHFDSTKKAMKISGIATCCLAGYTLLGAIGCMYTDNEFLYASSETAMWLGFGSAATYLVSWMLNSGAKHDLAQISPFVIPSPVQGSGCVAGLALSARF